MQDHIRTAARRYGIELGGEAQSPGEPAKTSMWTEESRDLVHAGPHVSALPLRGRRFMLEPAPRPVAVHRGVEPRSVPNNDPTSLARRSQHPSNGGRQAAVASVMRV